tara:strand:- start:50 stop:844 length:795 start_codon:yes stop_codon:yes gene_type:complete
MDLSEFKAAMVKELNIQVKKTKGFGSKDEEVVLELANEATDLSKDAEDYKRGLNIWGEDPVKHADRVERVAWVLGEFINLGQKERSKFIKNIPFRSYVEMKYRLDNAPFWVRSLNVTSSLPFEGEDYYLTKEVNATAEVQAAEAALEQTKEGIERAKRSIEMNEAKRDAVWEETETWEGSYDPMGDSVSDRVSSRGSYTYTRTRSPEEKRKIQVFIDDAKRRLSTLEEQLPQDEQFLWSAKYIMEQKILMAKVDWLEELEKAYN